MNDINFEALPLFDTVTVDRLQSVLGEDRYKTLAEFLPEEGWRVLAELKHARGSGDLSMVKVAAHALRGVSGNFGASRLEAIGRAMNMQDASLQDLDKLAAPLERCIAEMESALS